MSHQAEAEENLRVIRSLMEKATVYRAISAPGALIGGVCALGMAIWGRWDAGSWSGPDAALGFLMVWLSLLALAGTTNLILLARDARRRREAFFSPGMRLALRAMLPALLGGGAITSLILVCGPALIASLWVLFYGISLLAASHFAPKSICWLGRAFFVAGVTLIGGGFAGILDWEDESQLRAAHDIMGATFGMFHVIYAAITWPRKAAAIITGSKP